MAQIFNAPSKIAEPNYDFANYTQANSDKEEKRYFDEIRAFLKENGNKGKNVGETIRIPMADSYAEYMVASMSPLQLIHLKVMDCWNSEFAELLTAKKVNEMIASDKAMKKLFSKG